jgi:hypothetical protein
MTVFQEGVRVAKYRGHEIIGRAGSQPFCAEIEY